MTDRLATAVVAVVGFGNQGAAQAEALRAAGSEVVVGARPGGSGEARARAAGFAVLPPAEALRRAAVAAILVPDEVVSSAWPGLAEGFHPGLAFVFAHGFALLYDEPGFPAGSDVVLVAPTAPGAELGRARARGETIPAYVAVHRDAGGGALALAEAYAARIGLGPIVRTTVREETEVDLFGEQAVLCGGLNALTLAAFETLVARGYAPEMAYLECVHQLRYLADLLHARGPAGFRRAISATARYGDLTRGPRVVGEASREAMGRLLDEIASGAFASEWLGEARSGAATLERLVAAAADHPIENARARAVGGPAPGGAKSRNAMSKN